MSYTIANEKEQYDKLMYKYRRMDDKKLQTIIKILNNTEGLCMPEFLEFCKHLIALDKKK